MVEAPKNWLSVLMAHLMRCEKTIVRALDKIEPKDIAQQSSGDIGFLWHCSREYYRKYDKAIPLSQLEMRLAERMDANSMDVSDMDELIKFVGWIYDINEKDFEPEESYELIGRLLNVTRVEGPVSKLIAEGADVQSLFDTMRKGIEEASVSKGTIINPMAQLDKVFNMSIPKPLGGNDIHYFNKLCQGGLMPGEVVVLMGPQGGFKTTCAIDVCASMALTKQRAMFLAYEQDVEKSILLTKFVSRMTGIPLSRWQTERFQDHITPQEEQIIEKTKQYGDYFMCLDRSKACDRISDIAAIVREASDSGKHPDLVVIDQFMTWIAPWNNSYEDMWHILRDLVLKLKHAVAEQLQTRIILIHQLAGNVLGKSGNYKPVASDSSGSKSVGNWADFVVCLGKLDDKTGCMWAVTGKTRRGKYTEVILEPDGDHGRLVESQRFTESKSNPGHFVKIGEENKLPKANARIPTPSSVLNNNLKSSGL